MVYDQIVLRYSKRAFPNIKIYDGPGPMSPEISARTARVHLSSYQGFVIFFAGIRYNKTDAYKYANNHSYINSRRIKWSSYSQNFNNILSDSKDSNSSHNKGLHFRGTSGRCWLQTDQSSMTIHQMTFIGVNMLRHSPSSRIPTCQYGDLFVVWVNPYPDFDSHNYITICSNVSHKTTFPISNALIDLFKTWSLILIFITFDGYSNGFVDITLGVDDECYGSDVVISKGPFGSNILSHWTDQSYGVIEQKNNTVVY